jgi:hypothetical protein
LDARPESEFCNYEFGFRLLVRAAEIDATAEDSKRKRLAARASLAGLLMMVADHCPIVREAKLLRPAESLFTELGDLDNGVVASALQREKKPPTASTSQRRFQRCCIRADELLRRSGMKPSERLALFKKQIGHAAKREGIRFGKSTLKNWRARHAKAADSELCNARFSLRLMAYETAASKTGTPGKVGVSRQAEIDERLKAIYRRLAISILTAVENGEFPDWVC